MNKLTNQELLKTAGGSFHKWLLAGLGAGMVFFASIIYGFVHPNKC